MSEYQCAATYLHPRRVEEAVVNLVEGPTAIRLAETFRALSDPTRVRIVSLLNGA